MTSGVEMEKHGDKISFITFASSLSDLMYLLIVRGVFHMERAETDRVRQTPACAALQGKKGTWRNRMYYISVLQ